MSSANAFNLDQSKMLSFGKGRALQKFYLDPERFFFNLEYSKILTVLQPTKYFGLKYIALPQPTDFRLFRTPSLLKTLWEKEKLLIKRAISTEFSTYLENFL